MKTFMIKKCTVSYLKTNIKRYQSLSKFDEREEISIHYKKLLNFKLSKSEAEAILKQKEKNVNNYFTGEGFSSNLSNIYNLYGIKSNLINIIEFIKTGIADSDQKSLKKLSEYYFNIEGKMVRPLLILLFAKYIHECKYPNNNEDFFKTITYNNFVKPYASCIEVIHNASLLHDDIIDNSNLRRNCKTAHVIYGIRPTVFGANYIISKAASIIAELNIDHLNEIFSSIVYQLTYGEVRQTLEKPSLKLDTTKENVEEYFENYMIKTYYKTASLIALSLRGIAIIFELNDHLQKNLFNLGLHLGLVFQIIDDLMDVLYDSKQIMKPNFNDLKEGIINSYLLFEIYDDPTNKLLSLIYGKFTEEKDFDLIVEILNKGTGLLKAQCLALDHSYSALKFLDDPFFRNNKTKDTILSLISLLIKRKK